MSLMTDPSSGRTNVDAESANRGEADEIRQSPNATGVGTEEVRYFIEV
jgi:hypothetical protein